jgi:hypothetical protein
MPQRSSTVLSFGRKHERRWLVNRRTFITLIGGAAATWPLAARAQQPAMPVIGLLDTGGVDSNTGFLRPFREGLGEACYFEGQNVAIEYRWAETRTERFPEIAAELVRLSIDIIVPTSTAAALACKQATAVIPIVFPLAGDPLALAQRRIRPNPILGRLRPHGCLADKSATKNSDLAIMPSSRWFTGADQLPMMRYLEKENDIDGATRWPISRISTF